MKLPESEPYIVKHPGWASEYARDVIKGRWPEAEPYILNSRNVYAIEIYKDAFPSWLTNT